MEIQVSEDHLSYVTLQQPAQEENQQEVQDQELNQDQEESQEADSALCEWSSGTFF